MYPDMAEQGTPTTTQTVIMGVAPSNKGYAKKLLIHPPSHLLICTSKQDLPILLIDHLS
jgi:hypothetical protein